MGFFNQRSSEPAVERPVLVRDRVLTSIDLGESHFREFKSAQEGPPGAKTARDRKEIAKDICSTLVGFANADGGTLLVGVEDGGDITGLRETDEKSIDYLKHCWRDGVHKSTPLRQVHTHVLSVDDKTIIYFATSKSTEFVHLTSDGKCLQRRDLETVPIAVEEIQYSRLETLSQEYDRQFVDEARVSDLNLEAVSALANQISRGMTVEKCLQHLDLADSVEGELRLRKAALLLFAKDIVRWHPRVQIRIIKVAGTILESGASYNAESDTYVRGNILELIDGAWSELRPHLVQTRLSGSAKFETKVLYPELACRESLINAIAHRDYAQEGRGIEIYVFQDRMEVRSPGGLLSTLSIEDLKKLTGAHQSRNSFVSRVLRELGFMREVGEGMKRIFELMQSNELAEPDIDTDQTSFSVILKNKTLYAPEHLLWLESFSDFDLTREEKAIVVLGYNGRVISPNDIWNTLGLVDTEHYRQLVASLQEKDILRSTTSKPQAQRLAKLHKVNVRDVPRFSISVPDGSINERKSALSGGSPRRRRRIAPLPDLAENFDPEARVFVANVPFTITAEQVRGSLRQRGFEADVHWPENRGRRRPYLFLQFDTVEAAKIAIAELDGLDLGGRKVVARPAVYRETVPPTIEREGPFSAKLTEVIEPKILE